MAHDIIDCLCRGDTILDEPEGFAPHRLQQAVADKGIYFLFDMHRLHADFGIGLHGAGYCGIRCFRPADNLNHRQQVNRVIGMRHHDAVSER